MGYLNINSLRKKIISLREILLKAPIDILCIDETKLDDSFPDAQFLLNEQYCSVFTANFEQPFVHCVQKRI